MRVYWGSLGLVERIGVVVIALVLVLGVYLGIGVAVKTHQDAKMFVSSQRNRLLTVRNVPS